METQNAARTDSLRGAIEAAGAEQAHSTQWLKARLRFERLSDGRYVLPIDSIDQGIAMLAAPRMLELLMLSALLLAKEPGSDAFKLSAEITRLLRQIKPE